MGRTISASPDLPLRILAANILREISLAGINAELFWPPDVLAIHDPRIPSSFLADVQWLQNIVQYLRDVDDYQSVPHERLAFLVRCSVAGD